MSTPATPGRSRIDWRLVGWGAALLLLALGLGRVRFDVEVLDLLPRDLPAVRGLQLYQRHFADTRELILTLETPDPDTTERAALSLGDALRRDTALDAEVLAQPPWLEHPADVAELVAYLWLQRPEAEVAQLVERFQPGPLRASFRETRETLATSFSFADLSRRSYDPLGLGQTAGVDPTLDPLARGGADWWSSADGRFRLLFLRPREALPGYRECTRWMNRVEKAVAAWRAGQPPCQIRSTGQPAFMAEIGGGMERDLVRSVVGTTVFVGLIFFLAHRRWRPLVQLVIMLGLVLAGTVAVGGLCFGRLNVVSVGFAAMLLGLAADYGLLLYQEHRTHPELGVAGIRGIHWRGITCAALTTAVAFGTVALSSMPGLRQLGMLVGIGIGLAAVVMLRVYLHWFLAAHRVGPATSPPSDANIIQSTPTSDADHRSSIPVSWGVGVTAILLFAAGTLLALRGLPPLDRSTEALRPINSQAHAALEHLRARLKQADEPWWLVVAGTNDLEVLGRLEQSETRLRQAVARNQIAGFTAPTAFWPNPIRQRQNRHSLGALAAQQALLHQLAAEEGLAPAALEFTDNVLQNWSRWAERDIVIPPTNTVARWMLSRFLARETDSSHAVILVQPAVSTAAALLPTFRALEQELTTPGVWLTSWPALGGLLAERVERDLALILPVVVVLVVTSLFLTFRRWTEVALSLTGLASSSVLLLALMALLDWSWNLMNLVALPLLLGAGVDYGIHVQLALRRHPGQPSVALRGVGLALLLCSATTMAGFSSLAWCSNSGLAALGRVCALGIAVTLVVSLLLLPGWWTLCLGHSRATSPASAPPSGRSKAPAFDGPSRLYRAAIWQLGLAIARRLPRRIAHGIARMVAAVFWHLGTQRRRVVADNLVPALGGDRVRAQAAARRLYDNFACKLADLWWYESGRGLEGLIGELVGTQLYQEAVASRRGLLLVSPHLGNWEFGAPIMSQRGELILALTLAEPDTRLTDLRRASRARYGIETLVIRQDPFAFVEVIRRLEAGAVVALLIDRPPQPTAVRVELLGQPFDASVAPAELARASGCLVLPVYLPRDSRNRYAAHILPAIPYDRPALRDPDARREFTQRIVRAFEPVIRQHPDQWYHFVPIWPSGADAPARRSADQPGRFTPPA